MPDGAVGSFADLYTQLQRTIGATQRVRELLREPPEESGGAGGPPVAGEVAVEDVTFAYPSRPEVTVLRGLSLRARAGERIALVGPSGAGKSTIVSLLLRFYDPDAGRVPIDGRGARDYPLGRLRGRMAIVPQDVLLFGGWWPGPGASTGRSRSCRPTPNGGGLPCREGQAGSAAPTHPTTGAAPPGPATRPPR